MLYHHAGHHHPFNVCVSRKRAATLLAFLVVCVHTVFSQSTDPVSYVNPFIGTANSDVLTRWGSEGGTYPGAVAPFGYVQITPETSVADKKGYYYSDSSIYFFSGVNHHSGYPNGSAGQLSIMPVKDVNSFTLRKSSRPFRHSQEKAEPGFYSVKLSDDYTLVEAVASERSGMIRFTFPTGVTPAIFIGDMGMITMQSKQVFEGSRWNAVLRFGEDILDKHESGNGFILTFSSSSKGPKVITLTLGVSTVSKAGALKNIEAELNTSGFDQLKDQVRARWSKQLSVVGIEDEHVERKTIFYTALYHSLLLPWIISDGDGSYKGRDGSIHQTTGKNEYGGFSPWDTYRTLHPLLTLLFPDRQHDMMLSMMDAFRQSGHLPIDPMTGNHAVPILVDSYLKGLTGIDNTLLYAAMKKSIDTPPYLYPDIEAYQKHGYLSSDFSESVTRTVEYAYDDWALSQFATSVMHSDQDSKRLLARSYSYRNLFNAQTMFLLPRKGNEFKLQPGNFGYKEGDKWVYSYAVPYHNRDLINLMGGRASFVTRLDSALVHQQIIFDNETVLHVPYLFNAAGRPDKTQEWVRTIMDSRYKNTPGGLPGNDDLGSMSSWYVFSAMGIFPMLPGSPVYAIGSPLFRSITLHLPEGKKFIIKSGNASPRNRYVRSMQINKKNYKQSSVPHATIASGGEMYLEMDKVPGHWFLPDASDKETKNTPDFTVHEISVSKKKVKPNELFWIRFSITNKGGVGTKAVRLYVNGGEYSVKNCLVYDQTTLADSIGCRLYTLGKMTLKIDEYTNITVEVVDPNLPMAAQMEIQDITMKPVLKLGEALSVTYTIRNIGWLPYTFKPGVFLDGSSVQADSVRLAPGERKMMRGTWAIHKTGFHTLRIQNQEQVFKIFDSNAEALVVDISLRKNNSDVVMDSSGFNNHGHLQETTTAPATINGRLELGKDRFIEISSSPSLDNTGDALTMMAWVYPTKNESSDLLTKGDHHVLQTAGGQKLNFFAGGWGRGECTADLPPDWKDHWHHIAGVCDGRNLRVYIDGVCKAVTPLSDPVNLSVASQWNIGRNEEFPSERIFNGYMDKVKIFAAPLSGEEIISIVKKERNVVEKGVGVK